MPNCRFGGSLTLWSQRTRQDDNGAVGGLGVRYVLGFGLALVVIAFAIIYFTNFR